MARPKGSKDSIPRKPREKKPTVSAATAKAMDKAAADSNGGINLAAFDKLFEVVIKATDEKATLFAEYRNACKGPAGRIKTAKKIAREAGVPLDAAMYKIDEFLEKRAREKKRRELEPDTLSLVQKIENARKALGSLADTPIGRAHLKVVESQAEADLRPPFLKDKDEAAAEANTAALTGEGGIKQLEETEAAGSA